MYDYRLVSAYMSLHMPTRKRRPVTDHPARRVYQLPTVRPAPRNDRSR